MTLSGTLLPRQTGGQVLGPRQSDGVYSSVTVTWLADTGADITTVRDGIGRLFRYQSTGATASPTIGGGGIHVVSGLDIEFTAVDSSGATTTVKSAQLVGVKSNNAGDDVLGMDGLSAIQGTITWDPHSGTGDLRI